MKHFLHKLISKQVLLFLLGIALIFVCFQWLGPIDWVVIGDANMGWLVFSVLATIVLNLQIAMRWSIFIKNMGAKLRLSSAFEIVTITSFFSFILPKEVSDIGGRSVLLKKNTTLNLAESANTVLCDRLADILFLLGILPASLFFIYSESVAIALIIMAVGVLLTYLVLIILGNKIFSLFAILFCLINKACAKFSFLKNKINLKIVPVSIKNSEIHLIALFTIFRFFASFCIFWMFSQALNLEIPLSFFIIAVPLMQLVFLFSFTPGGLGVLEVGWAAVFMLFNMDLAIFGVYIIAQRVFTILTLVIVWILARGISIMIRKEDSQ